MREPRMFVKCLVCRDGIQTDPALIGDELAHHASIHHSGVKHSVEFEVYVKLPSESD